MRFPFSLSFKEGCHNLTHVLRSLVSESEAWRLRAGETMQSPGGSYYNCPGRIMIWTGTEGKEMWVAGDRFKSEN